LETEVQRLKTEGGNHEPDKIVHFCHVDDFTKCYFFIILYYLVLKNSIQQSEYMFPHWEKFVTRNGESESKVSGHFKQFWCTMKSLAQEYVSEDELSQDDLKTIDEFCLRVLHERRGSHSCKKKGVQDLGDNDLTPQVSFVSI
jgi:hypothetical protein